MFKYKQSCHTESARWACRVTEIGLIPPSGAERARRNSVFRRRRLRCRGPAPRKRSSEQTQWRRTPAGATLPPAPCRASASDLRGQLDAALRADATRYGPGCAVSGRTNWRASERHAEKPPVSSAPDGSQRGGDQDFAANCWQPSKQYRDEARPHQMRAARTSQGVLKGDVL